MLVLLSFMLVRGFCCFCCCVLVLYVLVGSCASVIVIVVGSSSRLVVFRAAAVRVVVFVFVTSCDRDWPVRVLRWSYVGHGRVLVLFGSVRAPFLVLDARLLLFFIVVTCLMRCVLRSACRCVRVRRCAVFVVGFYSVRSGVLSRCCFVFCVVFVRCCLTMLRDLCICFCFCCVCAVAAVVMRLVWCGIVSVTALWMLWVAFVSVPE